MEMLQMLWTMVFWSKEVVWHYGSKGGYKLLGDDSYNGESGTSQNEDIGDRCRRSYTVIIAGTVAEKLEYCLVVPALPQ
jgi:hypothetical protein